MEFMDVTGAFYAPDGEPLSGSVSLKPSVPVIRVSDGAVVQSEVSFPVVEGKLSARVVAPSEGVQPSAWSYRVVFKLKRPRNFSVSLRGFDFPAQTGTVDLNAVAPVPSPVAGVYETRGEPGRDGISVSSISSEGGWIVFTLTDGQQFRAALPDPIPGEKGEAGRGIASMYSEADIATVVYTDGAHNSFVLPQGLPGERGEDGAGIEGMNLDSEILEDGSIQYTLMYQLTTGEWRRGGMFVAPKGEQGERGERGEQGAQGVPGAPNTLSIGTVTGGASASATLTGSSPNQVLNLVLPKGDKGDTGAVGAVGPQGPAGNVTVSQSASTIQGNGYPEGVVSAPVGSLYIDLQETNGAVMWRKKSGTGSTGWVVLKGDTGWRKVSADTSIVTPSYADAAMGGSGRGAHAIRRIDNQIHWLTYWYQNTSTSGKFADLPKGFWGQNMVPGGGYGIQEVARLGNTTLQQQNGQRLMVTSMNAGELRFYAQWNTDDPYPNTLPGSPA